MKPVEGYTIKIERAKSLGGWMDIHYSCFRDSDRLEVCSGCGAYLGLSHKSSVRAYIVRRIKALEALENQS